MWSVQPGHCFFNHKTGITQHETGWFQNPIRQKPLRDDTSPAFPVRVPVLCPEEPSAARCCSSPCLAMAVDLIFARALGRTKRTSRRRQKTVVAYGYLLEACCFHLKVCFNLGSTKVLKISSAICHPWRSSRREWRAVLKLYRSGLGSRGSKPTNT